MMLPRQNQWDFIRWSFKGSSALSHTSVQRWEMEDMISGWIDSATVKKNGWELGYVIHFCG